MAAHGNPNGPGAVAKEPDAVVWPRFTSDGSFARLNVASKGGCSVATGFHDQQCVLVTPWLEAQLKEMYGRQ